MNSFYIITNRPKDQEMRVTQDIVNYLEKHGKKTVVAPNEIPEDADCILVLGGDGTLLKASTDYLDYDIPFIGINLGTLGFLAEIDKANIEPALDALMNDQYEIEERMMLDGFISFINGNKGEYHALNDIVLTRKGSLRIVSYDIYVNGQFLNTYKADGVIISTPTGSTGYNMSAGGPIIEPKAKILLLTPICPHAFTARSIILSSDDKIEIRVPAGPREEDQEIEINFDGSIPQTLHTGAKIEICQSNRVTKIIRLKKESFLEVLHRKMNV